MLEWLLEVAEGVAVGLACATVERPLLRALNALEALAGSGGVRSPKYLVLPHVAK